MNLTLHEKLCHDMHELCVAKNKRYGDSFSKTVCKYGLISALTRMEDKWNRIEEIILNHADGSADESLEDSLMDLANYSLMTICEIKTNQLTNENPPTIQVAATTSASRSISDFGYKENAPCVDSSGYAGPMSNVYDKFVRHD